MKLAAKIVKVNHSSGHNVDKFKAFGLTQLSAEIANPPRSGECFANLECRAITPVW